MSERETIGTVSFPAGPNSVFALELLSAIFIPDLIKSSIERPKSHKGCFIAEWRFCSRMSQT